MMLQGLLGRRIVVRYRRADPGDGPPLTDVVGELTALTDVSATVLSRSGPVEVDRSAITVAKLVAANRGDILDLQRIARLGWRAAETAELDGWLLTADKGWTGRANSVLPLRTPARPVTELIEEARRFYAARGLPLQIQVPLPARGLLDAELAGRCWTIERPTVVLTRRIEASGGDPAAGVDFASTPSTEWLAGYHYRGGTLPGHAVALLTRHNHVTFASLPGPAGVAAIVRATVDEHWLGVTALEVAANHRREGLAGRLMAAVLDWGRAAGATLCYLQVDETNAAALALYEGLGFSSHHRYHYRVPPGGA